MTDIATIQCAHCGRPFPRSEMGAYRRCPDCQSRQSRPVGAYLTPIEQTEAFEICAHCKAVGFGPVSTANRIFDALGIDKRNAEHKALRDIVRKLVRAAGVR